MEPFVLIGFVLIAIVCFVLVIVFLKFFTTWLRARVASAPVSIGKMIGMSLRKVPVGLIVDNRITAVKAGIDIASDPLEAHYLAGGDVSHVVLALIAELENFSDGLDEVADITGHEVGGVCPFGLKAPLPVYCDISMKAFDIVVPAAGSTHSAVRIAPKRMAELTSAEWVDVCQNGG